MSQLGDLSLLEHLPQALGVTDVSNRFIYTNRKFEALFGYDAGELIGQPGYCLNAPSDEDPALVTQRIMRAIADTGVWTGEVRCVRKSGEAFWTRAKLAVHEHPTLGTLWVGTQEDITAEKSMEEQLLHAQKLEALGTMAGGIAHEFNNLLSVIQGNLEMLLLDPERADTFGDDLADVLVATQGAGELVGQILQFARKEPSRLQKVSPGPVVARACRLAAVTAGDARISCVDDAADVLLHANPTELHQVCLNLLNNAVHALPHGEGVVEVRASTAPGALLPSDVVSTELREADEVYVLQVLDTGHGVPTSLRSRIFDPFFTTKPPGQGTGLGLPVVARIVRNHGGVIVVRSRASGGTEFAVYLPLFDPSTPSLSPPAPVHGSEVTKGVLVVEDQPSLARIFERFLNGRGYAARVCHSADEALEVLGHPNHGFDLVVTDLEMPGTSGAELAAFVRRSQHPLPVIVTTGFADSPTRARLHELGVARLLDKPVELAELDAAVCACLSEAIAPVA